MEKQVIENLSGMANMLTSLDTASEVPVGFELGNGWSKTEDYKGVWNVSQGHLSSIVSKRYSIIQHEDVMRAVTEKLGELGIQVSGLFKNYNDIIQADLVFTNKGVPIKDDAKGIQLGIRVMNSYNKKCSFRLEMFGYRLICSNGMALGKTLGVRETVFHTGSKKSYELICKITNEFVNEVINSSKTLQKYVDEMMADTMGYENAKKILFHIIKRKKHYKAIMEIFGEKKKVSRWDIYNAITSYFTHNESLQRNVINGLEKKSQKLMLNNSAKLIEKANEIVVELPQ